VFSSKYLCENYLFEFILGGLKNQIRPDDFREEKEKWRQATRTLSTTQLRRLPSSGSLLHSQQPYSSSVPNEHFEYHPGTSQQR
jgi:hypothetical protein